MYLAVRCPGNIVMALSRYHYKEPHDARTTQLQTSTIKQVEHKTI